MVSRSVPIITVTVSVKGVPAITWEGAVNSKVACLVPQPSIDADKSTITAVHRCVPQQARADRGYCDSRDAFTWQEHEPAFRLHTVWTRFVKVVVYLSGSYSEAW